VNVSFLQELLNTVAERGRQYLPSALVGGGRKSDLDTLTRALVSNRGEASGVAIAHEILKRYRVLDAEGRLAFFRSIAETMRPDGEAVTRAATRYLAQPDAASLAQLQAAVESPRQEFFRRLNLAPGATADIVAMRRELLQHKAADPALMAVDADMEHLLSSWFNRGFLVLRRIDWNTPAAILEKIIAYEAVHEIQGWDDLRRRLDPNDRRCFGFFHPSLVDEPLIFVEVALMETIPDSIQAVLGEHPGAAPDDGPPTTAVFYSISNCQEGLRGISFGNFLIKQVVEELVKERPSLKTFVTLSPVPGFAAWLDRVLLDDPDGVLSETDRQALSLVRTADWFHGSDEGEALKAPIMALAAHYFLRAKTPAGRAIDPVARFHLGNGASLERINWLGDISKKGLEEAHGLMVNYRYDLDAIEANHEAFAKDGVVTAAKAVRGLLRPPAKARADAARRLMPPSR
jgi:malonyl-CoA decarboxylase